MVSRMFRRTLLGLFLLVAAAIPASAQFNGCVAGFCSSSNQWVFPGATLDLDFANNRYFGVANGIDSLTVSRASSGYAEALNGTWVNFGNNIARRTDRGLLVEESRTNVVLYNRDLTNAAWTKSNVTVAKDQTGIDGVTNSASSATSTSTNGTVLQAITLGSSARFQTAFVKRLVGSGIIQMTMDNGSTWTTVTVTAGWTRVSIPTQTLSNQTVGFRLATSGDSIAIDMVQNENGTFATSPIAVTTVAATRTADVVTLGLGPWFNASAGTLYTQALRSTSVGSFAMVAALGDGSYNNRIFNFLSPSVPAVYVTTGGVSQAQLVSGAVVIGTPSKSASAYAANDFAFSGNGATVATDTSGTVPTVTSLYLGITGPLGDYLNGYIQRVAYFPSRLPNATLQSITQ